MAAADHALDSSGASRIVWVGVRFGAMVAAEALARRNDAAALALWEPVVRAREHFRKLMRHVLYYALSQGERPSLTVEEMVESIEREGRVSVLRFDLEREFFRSAIDLDLLRIIGGWSGPTMLAQFNRHSRLSREHLSLKDHLERHGATVVEAMFAEQANPDDSGDPWRVPEAIIGRMGEWLDEMV